MSPSRTVLGFLESVVYGERKDLPATITKGALIALSGLYRAIIRLYLLPFQIGLRPKKRLEKPVISVGNITVGGTGKTPTVQYLCRGLAGRGWNPAVLSYGYGGSLNGRFGVVSDRSGALLTPKEAGDEPVMLAASLAGMPVLVCKHRHKSGSVAVQDFGADILLLDDGFQVWKLHRDMDILLINAENPFDNGRTLPAGRLRESPHALRRADCVIVTGACDKKTRDHALAQIGRMASDMPVYFARFRPTAVISLADGSETPADSIRQIRVLALSSIANPGAFEQTLAETGAVIVGREQFPDHHLYSDEDVDQIGKRAAERAAEFIVTTEKDAVKLRGHRFYIPIAALRGELELENEAGFWDFLARKIGRPECSTPDGVDKTRHEQADSFSKPDLRNV